MATKQKSNTRHELIRCRNCGEDYSITYRRCPFCDEYTARQTKAEPTDAGRTQKTSRRGGKRVQARRGGGYGAGWSVLHILTTVLSLALIIAAVFIVLTFIKPMIDRGDADPEITPAVDVTPTPEVDAVPDEDIDPEVDADVDVGLDEEPQVDATVVTGISLSTTDVTCRTANETFRLTATLSPSGATGDVVWSSSNSSIATVSANGTVTALSSGTATITATVGDVTAQCIVRNSLTTTSDTSDTTASDTSSTTASDLTLSHSDVTLRSANESFTLTVTGSSADASYASSDSSVVSVSSSGRVTAVGAGSATVTVTVGGQTLKCIVRCSF